MGIPLARQLAFLRLHLADGVGPLTFKKLLDHFGDVEKILTLSQGDLRQVDGVGPKTAAAIAASDESAAAEELAVAEKHGAIIICMEDPDYPPALKHVADPPPVLYVRGRLLPADAVSLAIVGSRRCTHYGMEQAGRFGGLLARAGMTVISGGARGIDAAAHRGALEAGGRTIAVMGCGLCNLYPPENAKLLDWVVAQDRGALVSELPMRTAVLPGNFPTRNRIISGMSLGVLVVEAARRSGSLITASQAVEQGKEVFAVPGRVDSPFSQGTNQLIADHSAKLVQELDDVLDALEGVGKALKSAGAPMAEAKPAPRLEGMELALFGHLDGSELPLDELVRRSGLPSGQVTAAMTMLVIKGVVAQKPGGIFALKRR
jgi:DNA processing protein